MANEAYVYDTGPVYVYARVPTPGIGPFVSLGALSGTIFHLGTAERFPQRREEAVWEPVFNDIGGKVPFDESFQGETAQLVVDLNRFNQTVLDLIRRVPDHGRGLRSTALGGHTRLAVGALLLQNGMAFEMWAQHSHYDTINAVADLPPGRYYPACKYIGCYEEESSGTQPRKCRLVVEPKRVWNASTKGFITFSEEASFFTALPEPL